MKVCADFTLSITDACISFASLFCPLLILLSASNQQSLAASTCLLTVWSRHGVLGRRVTRLVAAASNLARAPSPLKQPSVAKRAPQT